MEPMAWLWCVIIPLDTEFLEQSGPQHGTESGIKCLGPSTIAHGSIFHVAYPTNPFIWIITTIVEFSITPLACVRSIFYVHT